MADRPAPDRRAPATIADEGARISPGTSGRRLDNAPSVQALKATARTLNTRPPSVLQAKLIRDKKTITPWFFQTPSPVAKRYMETPDDFVLRDDSSVTASPIHVLPANSKYLLGEVHNDGTWAARTANWSSIPKLHESRKAIPGADAGDTPGALESMHAYAMQAALAAQTLLHPLHRAWSVAQANRLAVAVPPLPPNFALMLAQGTRWTGELLTAGNQYRAFAQKYVARNGEPAIAAVRAFSATFEATYRTPIVEMSTDIATLTGLGNQALAAAAQPQQDRIYANRAFLENIVTDLLALQAAVPAANVPRIQQISQRGAANDPIAADYLAAGTPHREAAMINNVNAAAAPVMVQLGNAHVDPVAAGVADSVKIKVGIDLDAQTRKSN
ncbi:MAG: hypothetical protein JWL96_4138 [Sphingomonas bacterium]|nr:hypothetical protein [Sphingomonas bacterium]